MLSVWGVKGFDLGGIDCCRFRETFCVMSKEFVRKATLDMVG